MGRVTISSGLVFLSYSKWRLNISLSFFYNHNFQHNSGIYHICNSESLMLAISISCSIWYRPEKKNSKVNALWTHHSLYNLLRHDWIGGGALEADVQIMVYLGILVTRKFFNWQKISKIFTALCQNWTSFPWISSLSCRIFYETIQIRLFLAIFLLNICRKLF